MVKARITGLSSEVTKATQELNKCFDVLKVSNQDKNRNSSFVRVYVDLKLKEDNRPMNEKYLMEMNNLKDYEDYVGNVHSIIGEDRLITRDELKQQILQSLSETDEAPIVVIAENGERLDMTTLFLSCVTYLNKKKDDNDNG